MVNLLARRNRQTGERRERTRKSSSVATTSALSCFKISTASCCKFARVHPSSASRRSRTSSAVSELRSCAEARRFLGRAEAGGASGRSVRFALQPIDRSRGSTWPWRCRLQGVVREPTNDRHLASPLLRDQVPRSRRRGRALHLKVLGRDCPAPRIRVGERMV